MSAKTERFELRLKKETLDIVRTKAEKHGMTITELFIFCAVNSQIEPMIGNSDEKTLSGMKWAAKMFHDGDISAEHFEVMKARIIKNGEIK